MPDAPVPFMWLLTPNAPMRPTSFAVACGERFAAVLLPFEEILARERLGVVCELFCEGIQRVAGE